MNTTQQTDVIRLWRYNTVTGYWVYVRDCYRDRAQDWLRIFQSDEPDATFRASNRRPTTAPRA